MPQWRKLHIKTLESLDINDMPDDFTRLTWTLLPLILDSKGRILDNTSLIKSRLYPLRGDITAERVDEALEWFYERGMVSRYCVNGRRYLCVPTWEKYQGSCEREASSNYPGPEEATPDAIPAHDWPSLDDGDDSRPTHDLLTTSSCLEERRGEEIVHPANADEPKEPTLRDIQNRKIAELEDTFGEYTRLAIPERKTDKQKRSAAVQWSNPLREILVLVEWDIDSAGRLIRAAVDRLRGDDLTIACPVSILKTAKALHASGLASGANGRNRVMVEV